MRRPLPAIEVPTIRTTNTVLMVYTIVNLLNQAAKNGNPEALRLQEGAKVDIASLQPWQINSIIDLQNIFNTNPNELIDTLLQAGSINDQQHHTYSTRINHELDLINYAAKIAPLPEISLKYRNMVPIYDNKGNLTFDIESQTPSQFQAYLNELNQRTDESAREERILANKFNRIPLDPEEQERFQELSRQKSRAHSLPPAQRQQELERVERAYQKFEATLLEQQITKYSFFRRKLDEVDTMAKRHEKKLEKEEKLKDRQAFQETQREKNRILARLSIEWAGGDTQNVSPELQSVTGGSYRTNSGLLKIGQERQALRHSSLFNPDGTVNRAAFKKGVRRDSPTVDGAKQGVEFGLMVESLKIQIKDSVINQCMRFQGEDPLIIEQVATTVASEVAPEIARYLQDSLQTWKGVPDANRIAHIYDEFCKKEREFRTRVAASIVKTLNEHDPDFRIGKGTSFQKGRASAYLRAAIQGIETRPDTPVQEVKLKLKKASNLRRLVSKQWPGNQDVIYMTRRVEVPDHDGRHIVRGVTRTAIGQSLHDATTAFSKAYRLRKWTSDKADTFNEFIFGEEHLYGQRDTKHRKTQLAKQVAFTQGVLDVKQQIEKNPLPLIWNQINPLGFATGALPHIAWNYAPESLKKASIGTKAALITAAGWPILGPFAAGVALTHTGQLSKQRFDNTYGFPIFNTQEWLRAYSEGKAKEFVAHFLPLAKADNKGRAGIGVHLIPASWNIFCNTIGQTLLGKYNKTFLSLSPQVATAYSKSLRGQILKRLGRRWKDANKRRDPISIFIFGPLWEITKTLTVKVLETTGLLPGLNTLIKSTELGYLSEAWQYGGGIANINNITLLRNEALQKFFTKTKPFTEFTPGTRFDPYTHGWDWHTKMSPEANKYLNQIDKINERYDRLFNFGKVIKGTSAAWQGIKTLAEGSFRFFGVWGVSLLLTGNPVTATVLGLGYSVPWAFRKILTNPMYGGFHYFDEVSPGNFVGKWNDTIFQKSNWSKKWLGQIAKATNTPLPKMIRSTELSRFAKILGGVNKFMPWDGLWIGSLLVSLGIPWYAAFGVPVAIDLGVRVLNEITTWEKFSQFFAQTGPWARFTGGLSTIFNIGSLSYALEMGGLSGLFDVFTKGFSVSRLMKFATIPSTYLSFLGLSTAFGGTLLGMPGFIAAGVLTVGTIATDQLLRFFGNQFDILWMQHGLWGPFKFSLEKIWEFLKSKGWDVATGLASSIIGIFGLFSAAMKGDIQGVAISLIMMGIGGYLVVTSTAAVAPFPSAYFKPTDAEGTIVYQNKYLSNASKTFLEIQNEELTYKYRYNIKNLSKNNITSITLTETDQFEGIPNNSILNVTSDDKLTIDGNTLYLSETHNSEGTIERTFTIKLSDNLEVLMPDSDDKLCNTLIITIDDIQDANGSIANQENPIRIRKCIDNQGKIIVTEGLLTHIPISSGQITIPGQCFDADRVYGNGSVHGHRGLDFVPNPSGSTAYAISAGNGKVIGIRTLCRAGDRSGNCDGWGNYVMVQHGQSYKTIYAHLKTVYVSKGDQVQGGDRIGVVGTTGWSTGIHLHFGIVDGDLNTGTPSNYLNPCASTLDLCNAVPNSGGCTSQPERVTR